MKNNAKVTSSSFARAVRDLYLTSRDNFKSTPAYIAAFQEKASVLESLNRPWDSNDLANLALMNLGEPWAAYRSQLMDRGNLDFDVVIRDLPDHPVHVEKNISSDVALAAKMHRMKLADKPPSKVSKPVKRFQYSCNNCKTNAHDYLHCPNYVCGTCQKAGHRDKVCPSARSNKTSNIYKRLPWIVDSGASRCITPCKDNFSHKMHSHSLCVKALQVPRKLYTSGMKFLGT